MTTAKIEDIFTILDQNWDTTNTDGKKPEFRRFNEDKVQFNAEKGVLIRAKKGNPNTSEYSGIGAQNRNTEDFVELYIKTYDSKDLADKVEEETQRILDQQIFNVPNTDEINPNGDWQNLDHNQKGFYKRIKTVTLKQYSEPLA